MLRNKWVFKIFHAGRKLFLCLAVNDYRGESELVELGEDTIRFVSEKESYPRIRDWLPVPTTRTEPIARGMVRYILENTTQLERAYLADKQIAYKDTETVDKWILEARRIVDAYVVSACEN